MKKTINITLSQTLFYIEEEAYKILKNYLEELNVAFKNTSGKEEIIADVETHISELFMQMKKHLNYVISEKEVKQVIQIMGQPEDYIVDDEKKETEKNHAQNKKLYRDPDNKYIGGVMAGLGHYFGIKALWLRLLLIILSLFSSGTVIFIYVTLWCLMPRAKTTAEKLSMKGEPINISNIEKKIKEELNNVSNTIKSTNFKKAAEKIKKKSNIFFNFLENLIFLAFNFIRKFIGILFIFAANISLFAIFIGFTTIAISPILPLHMKAEFFIDFFQIQTPIWILSLFCFLITSVPLLLLLLLGLKLLNPKGFSISKILVIILISFWILALIILISFVINQYFFFNYLFF